MSRAFSAPFSVHDIAQRNWSTWMSDDDRYKELFNRAHEAVTAAADARKSRMLARSALLVSVLTLAVALCDHWK